MPATYATTCDRCHSENASHRRTCACCSEPLKEVSQGFWIVMLTLLFAAGVFVVASICTS